MVASKYEEILYNDLKDYQIITNFEFTQEELLDYEAEVLAVMSFSISQTCHLSIFEIVRNVYRLDSSFSQMCNYVAKLSTLDTKLCFQDSAFLSVSIACFLIKNSFAQKKATELSNFIKNTGKNLDSDFKRIIIEHSDS